MRVVCVVWCVDEAGDQWVSLSFFLLSFLPRQPTGRQAELSSSAVEAAVAHAAARLVDAGARGAIEDVIGVGAGGNVPAEVLGERRRVGEHVGEVVTAPVTHTLMSWSNDEA